MEPFFTAEKVGEFVLEVVCPCVAVFCIVFVIGFVIYKIFSTPENSKRVILERKMNDGKCISIAVLKHRLETLFTLFQEGWRAVPDDPADDR
jgi:hypothetical protein